MADLVLKKNDLFPFLEAVLSNAEGPIDLTAAVEVKVILKNEKSGAIIEGECTYPAPTTGNVIYKWAGSDTSIPGEYEVEWEIVWSGSKPERVPNSGTKTVLIEDILA